MAIFDNFPYTNTHEMNLDWMIKRTESVLKASDEIAANTLIAQESAENAAQSELNAKDSELNAKAAEDNINAYTRTLSQQVDTNTANILSNTEQINTLISGSTPDANAELLNIRVAYNGATYPTAGDSVRNQISDIHTVLNTLKTLQHYKLYGINGSTGYCNSSGVITSTENTNYKHYILPVAGLSDLYFTGKIRYTAMNAAVFRDADGNALSTYIAGTSAEQTYTNEQIPINYSAYDVVISFWKPTNNNYFIDYDLIDFVDPTQTLNSIQPFHNIKWACIGDSLTAANAATSKHYFDYIADITGITPLNMGLGGSGYMRGYDTGKAFYQRVLNIDTSIDVCTVFGSGNDLSLYGNIGEYTDTGTNTICGCINTFLDNYFSLCPTQPIGIILPTPWKTCPTNGTNTTSQHMHDYVAKLKQIASYRGVPVLDLYWHSNLRPEDPTNNAACFYDQNLDGYGDGVHPNALGHKIIASKILVFIKQLII